MQFIFITLLLANIALAVWIGVFSHDSHNDSRRTPHSAYYKNEAGQGLVLLAELSDERANDLGVERKLLGLKSLTPSQGELSTSDRCVILGPFVTKVDAGEMVAYLKSLSVLSSVESMAFPAGIGHWVYLPPFDSRKEALSVLSSLQRRKIDSYIVPKGENKNAISLGMFTKKDLAQAQFERVKALNFQAQLKSVQRTYNELWVMLKYREDEKVTDSEWANILKTKKNIKKRKNFCLGVALQQ